MTSNGISTPNSELFIRQKDPYSSSSSISHRTNSYFHSTKGRRKNKLTLIKSYSQENFRKNTSSQEQIESITNAIHALLTPRNPQMEYEIMTLSSSQIKPNPQFEKKYKKIVYNALPKRNIYILQKDKILEKSNSNTNDQSNSNKSESQNNISQGKINLNQSVHYYKIHLCDNKAVGRTNAFIKAPFQGNKSSLHLHKDRTTYDKHLFAQVEPDKPELNYRNRLFNYTQFKVKPIEEYLQCFGSTSTRKHLIPPSNAQSQNVGPGSYINDYNYLMKKAMLLSKQNNIKKLNENYIERRQIKASKNNKQTPGPGQYNISRNFGKDKYTKLEQFQSSEKRFHAPSTDDENYPGPGYYIKIHSWKKEIKNETLKPFYQKYPQILHKSVSCDSLWQKKEREDLLKKIENDNNEKQSSFKDNISKFSPFGSRLDKFSKISNYDVNKNGPGCYCKEIIHKLPPEKLKPDFFFKSKDKKCLLFNENEFRDVPHSFKKESYFQWNKKSYNSKYNKS